MSCSSSVHWKYPGIKKKIAKWILEYFGFLLAIFIHFKAWYCYLYFLARVEAGEGVVKNLQINNQRWKLEQIASQSSFYIKGKKELHAVHLHHLHVQPLLLAGEVVAAASPMLPLAHLVVIVVIVVVEGIQKKVEYFSPDCNSFPPTYVQCGQSIALLNFFCFSLAAAVSIMILILKCETCMIFVHWLWLCWGRRWLWSNICCYVTWAVWLQRKVSFVTWK